MVGTGGRWLAESVTPDGQLSLTLLLLNLTGAAAIGWLAGSDRGAPHSIWYFGATGVAGGLTTFSSFALDVAQRMDRQDYAAATALATSTLALAVAGAAFGFAVGRSSNAGGS